MVRVALSDVDVQLCLTGEYQGLDVRVRFLSPQGPANSTRQVSIFQVALEFAL